MARATKSVPVKRAREPAPDAPERVNPLLGLRQDIDRAFERMLGGWGDLWPAFGRELSPFRDLDWPRGPGAMPTVDVSETDTAWEITAELPGMDEKDIELVMSEGVLTLKGEKKDEREERKKDYHLSERHYGAFRRTFAVPQDVDPSKVGAQFTKGVLRITLPKSKEAQLRQRKIPVKGG